LSVEGDHYYQADSYANDPLQKADYSADHRFLFAVLERAVEDLRYADQTGKVPDGIFKEENRIEAALWMTSNRESYPTDFRALCENLGLCSIQIRKVFSEQIEVSKKVYRAELQKFPRWYRPKALDDFADGKSFIRMKINFRKTMKDIRQQELEAAQEPSTVSGWHGLQLELFPGLSL